MRELYEILGVLEHATTQEIKKAYRKLAKIHHPDKGGEEEIFAKIAEAYKILVNDELRFKYDNGEDVSTIISDKDQATLNICSIMDTIIKSPSFMPDHTNLVIRIREEINDMTLKIHNDLSEVYIDLGVLDTVKKRLKLADFLSPHLISYEASLEGRKKNIQKSLELQNIMLRSLDGAVYDCSEDLNEDWKQLEMEY